MFRFSVIRERCYLILHYLWIALFIFTIVFTEVRYVFILVKEGVNGNLIGVALGFLIGFTINAAQVGLVFGILRIFINMIEPKK